MNSVRFNVLTEISTYALKVRELLATMPNFEFLKKSANRSAYLEQQVKQRRISRQQIALYFKWLLVEFVNGFLKKYQLQLAKVHLVDSSLTVDQLEIEIRQTMEAENSEQLLEKARRYIRQYARKEMTNLSDAAWQSFIIISTNVCRNFTVLNFTFGFLDQYTGCLDDATMDPNTALGNFILGKFHIKKECYHDLKISLKEHWREVISFKRDCL